MKNLLRYKDSNQLTDAYYISPMDLKEKPNKVYCIDRIDYGDYITTTPVYGVIMRCPEKEISIGISLSTKETYEVSLIDVILL